MFLLTLLAPYLLYLIRSSDACAATSPTTTPTSCATCANNLITLTTIRGGSHAFQSDVVSVAGGCRVRTFTCVGTLANIELNGGAGVVPDGGAANGVATLVVTCNAAGTAWLYMGVAITQVECAST